MAQLVARYLGVVEAASSSLVTQTKKAEWTSVRSAFFICVAKVALVATRHTKRRHRRHTWGGRVSKEKTPRCGVFVPRYPTEQGKMK